MTPERPLNEMERAKFRALIQRRGTQEPVAHIIGQAGFWAYDFAIDRRALIPRPETEGIIRAVQHAAGTMRETELRIVDVGTGSGVLAICLALEFPNAQVVAIDKSDEALALSRENARQHEVADRVHLIHGDLLQPLIAKGSKTDIIVANPPYIGENERNIMSAGVAKWEPGEALFAGPDGFGVIDRLLPQIRHVLAPGGYFVMEFGSPQGVGIRARAERLFRQWTIIKDYGGHDRLLAVDGPGARPWSDASAHNPHKPSIVPADDANANPNTENHGTEDAPREGEPAPMPTPTDAMRYGGADGTERLPEIDLNADFDDDTQGR